MLQILKGIAVWGDSLLKGVILDAKGRYRTLVSNYTTDITEKTGLTIVNNSVFGCTAPKGAERMFRALDRGLECDYALIEYGSNDCDYNWAKIADDPYGEHECNTPMDKFVLTYRDIIQKLRKRAIEPILMTLHPIDGQKYLDFLCRTLNRERILAWLGEPSAIYRHHESYSMAITQIAREENCPLIDVRTPLLRIHQYSSLLCDDGIHPTECGHKIIGQIFTDFYKNFVANQVRPIRENISVVGV